MKTTKTFCIKPLWGKINKDKNNPTLILTGVSTNSKKESGDKPFIVLKIDLGRHTPEWLARLMAKEMQFRKETLEKELGNFINAVKI